MTRTLAIIWMLSLFLVGCISSQIQKDDFVSLHDRIQRTLAGNSKCGQIITSEPSGGRFFKVEALPRGLEITITELQYFKPKEWRARNAYGTNMLFQFMNDQTWPNLPTNTIFKEGFTNWMAHTNDPIVIAAIEKTRRYSGFTNGFGLFGLPTWHYRHTGVNVDIQDIDTSYPGDENDEAEAEKRYKIIIGLLQQYQ